MRKPGDRLLENAQCIPAFPSHTHIYTSISLRIPSIKTQNTKTINSIEANRRQLQDASMFDDDYVTSIIKDISSTIPTPMPAPTDRTTSPSPSPSPSTRPNIPSIQSILTPLPQPTVADTDTPPADRTDPDAVAYDFKYLQSLVYGGPRLQDAVTIEPMLVAGDFGLAADEAAAANEEIRQSPEYGRYMAHMESLDRNLERGIRKIMLDASIEFGMLSDLEKYADPNGDNETDIVKRVERYAAEFKSRLGEEQRSEFHSL